MKRFPILSLFEGIYFYAWLLITLSIILHLFIKWALCRVFPKYHWLYLYYDSYIRTVQITASIVGDALISELLFIHITFAILSYVAFAMSFVFAILYLIALTY